MNEKGIFREIENLTQYESFKFVLVEMLLRDFCGTADKRRDRDIREDLDYNELILLAALWLKNVDVSKNFDIDKIGDFTLKTYSLLKDLHYALLNNKKQPEVEEMNYRELFAYGPTNAYDFQYVNLVERKYRKDKDYIYNNYGQRLERYAEYFREIKYLIFQRLNDSKLRRELKDRNREIEIFILDSERDDRLFGIEGFRDFIDFYAIERKDISLDEFNSLSDFNPMRERPVIKLNESSYFVVSSFHLAEAMWEVFFYKMLKTDYRDIALKNRGNFAEDIIYHYLKNIFEDVYRNVQFKRNRFEELTDIDVCLFHEDIMLIFMVKTKKLTILSRKGNVKKVYDDYKKAILSSFEQGLLVKHIVEADEAKVQADNNILKALLKNVRRFYLFTVTQDDYPYQNVLNHIFLEKYTEMPISINIFDLEVMLNYLEDADSFITYTETRNKFLRKVWLFGYIVR